MSLFEANQSASISDTCASKRAGTWYGSNYSYVSTLQPSQSVSAFQYVACGAAMRQLAVECDIYCIYTNALS